jgi:hypothetical protein
MKAQRGGEVIIIFSKEEEGKVATPRPETTY